MLENEELGKLAEGEIDLDDVDDYELAFSMANALPKRRDRLTYLISIKMCKELTRQNKILVELVQVCRQIHLKCGVSRTRASTKARGSKKEK